MKINMKTTRHTTNQRGWAASVFAARHDRHGTPPRPPLASSLAALLGLLILAAPRAASAQFAYVATNSAVTITGYTDTNAAVVIPEVIEGLPVTQIGDFAFYFLESIRSLSIPASVTNIGSDAFEYCTGLTNVVLGENVASLRAWAFSGCSGLTNLTLPNRLASIGDYAFAYCTRLSDILLPGSVTNLGTGVFASCSKLVSIGVTAGNPSFSSADGVLFDHAQTTLVQFPVGRSGTYTLPASVIRIADSAFDGARGLSHVVIPDGVCEIGIGAFSNCRGLAGITLPATLTHLGIRAFSYCTNLSAADLPDSLTHIGDGPFANCSSLTAIRVGTGNPAYRCVDGVLFDLPQTRLLQYPVGKPGPYTVPSGVTHLGSSAFMGARSLTQLTLPETLTDLGDWVCARCSSLPGIVIPNQVRAISASAFQGCGSLAGLALGTNVARIGVQAFAGCPSLTNVTIPQSVQAIQNWAFSVGQNLAGVFFQGPPPNLEAGAFDACPGATAYYLPGVPGWSTNYGGLPTKLWNPSVWTRDPAFGVRAGHFGFTIAGTADIPVVVEGCTDLRQPAWQPVQSGSLTNGQFSFRNPAPSVGNARFYRVRWP